MGWLSHRQRKRVLISILVTIIILSLIILPAGPGLALNVSISKVPSTKTTYNLGEMVTFSGAISLAQGEIRDIQNVTLYIKGPQPLTLGLPVAEGTYDLTSQLPTDGQGQPLGALSVAVSWNQIGYVGYGYGYGYQGGAGGGQINYTINYTPPVFKYPPPPPPLPSINSPQFAFDVPGGGAASQTLNASFMFNIPGVPGAPQGSVPLGLTFDPQNFFLYILVNGTTNDMVIKVDPFSGFLYDFTDTGVTDAQALAWFDQDLYVAHGQPSSLQLKKVLDVTTGGPEGLDPINVPPMPGNLVVQGLTDNSIAQTMFAAYLQSDPAQGIPIKEIDPMSGAVINQFMVPGGPAGGGFTALVYLPQKGDLLGAYQDRLVIFDSSSGFIFETQDVSPSGMVIDGLTVSNTGDLYIADSGTKAIYMATPGSGGGGAQPFPRGLASDGTDLFILVDGSPNDKIIRVSTSGQNLGEFNAPEPAIEDITYMPATGKLYMIDNGFQRKLWSQDPANPASTQSWVLPNWVGEIGGLALSGDGSQLIAMERWTDTFHYIDPANGTVTNSVGLYSTGPAWMPGGLDAITMIQDPGGADQLLGGKWNNFFRFNPQSGEISVVDMVNPGMPPYDITGLALVGDVVYITDASTQEVFRGSLPGAPPPEPTTVGNYTAELEAVYSGGQVSVLSSPVAYTLQKVSPVTIQITSPSEGQAFTTPTIAVTGTVNDPTITQVTVGVALPTTTLFQSDVEETQSELNQKWTAGGMWHASGNGKKMGTKAWYYGQEPQMNYDTGQTPNMGDLDTQTITIGQGTTLTFYTWYDTEPGFDFDRKLIQWVTTSQTQTVAQIIDFFPPPQPGQPFVQPQPGTVYDPQQFPGPFPLPHKVVWVPMARFEQGGPTFTQITLDLSQYAGQTGSIRFKFDTGDAWGNNFEGWYIDGVSIQGAGFAGATVSVASDLTWQTQFTLAEGQNTISAQAIRNAYDPIVTVNAQVNVFKDQSNPVVVIDPVTTPTNNPIQTVTGSFTELAPDVLEMYVNNKLVLTEKSFTANTFSKSISLSEGTNSVLVKLTDKGGLVGQATATIELDTTGPVITVLPTSYPTGEVSARANDFFVFQVKAEDTATGILKVEVQMPGPGGQTQLQPFKPVSDIPVAVRNQWGVSTQATHIFPMSLPSSAPPGGYSLTAIATDNGGNTSSTTVSATVVSTLSKFNISLMPEWNLVSLPLIPDDTAIGTILAGLPAGSLNSVWYYDAATAAWKSYVPGAPTNDLTTLETGKGYWVRMNASAFTQSDPLAPGLPQTPVPIKLTISGVVLKPGQLPPTYSVVQGWNLVGLHAEHSKQVSVALKSLTSAFGADLWGSILEYQNFIYFPTQQGGEPQVVLGSFNSLGASDNMDPGKGYWLFMTQAGTIVP